MYKEVIDKKNKTITIITDWYEKTYTQKEEIKSIKKLIKDYLNGKVKEGTNYDLDEWSHPMKMHLQRLEKLL